MFNEIINCNLLPCFTLFIACCMPYSPNYACANNKIRTIKVKYSAPISILNNTKLGGYRTIVCKNEKHLIIFDLHDRDNSPMRFFVYCYKNKLQITGEVDKAPYTIRVTSREKQDLRLDELSTVGAAVDGVLFNPKMSDSEQARQIKKFPEIANQVFKKRNPNDTIFMSNFHVESSNKFYDIDKSIGSSSFNEFLKSAKNSPVEKRRELPWDLP